MSPLERSWYRFSWLTVLLLPLAALYCVVTGLRRALYRLGILATVRLEVPVLVVGNLTVGGTGKTPLVIFLACALRDRGYHPGIVSRGYGGKSDSWPREVHSDSDPALVGDEPVLLARHCECPVWVGPDRVAAARQLLRAHDCDVLLSDDGLQHLRLGRDFEIVVIDGERRFGNGLCLPAGPMRDPMGRLRDIDLVVVNGKAKYPGELEMKLHAQELMPVRNGSAISFDAFRGKSVHALAGIGNPGRFFRQLEALGMKPVPHAFPDHHRFCAADLEFANDLDIIMTEKDAVKCREIASDKCWYLAVRAEVDPDVLRQMENTLNRRNRG
jgi:tetraacyldisaccharide 4'-kinase